MSKIVTHLGYENSIYSFIKFEDQIVSKFRTKISILRQSLGIKNIFNP